MITWSINRLDADPTAAIHPPKQDKVLPKYLTAEQSMELLESTQTQSDFPERDYCMVTLFLNCGMRLAELVGMNLDDIDLENRQIRLFGKGHKERMVYLNDACMEALRLYLGNAIRWRDFCHRKRRSLLPDGAKNVSRTAG